MHRDLGSCTVDLSEIVGCEFDCNGSDVLIQAMQLRGAWDWNDPRLLGQQPRQGDLSGRRLLPLADLAEQINQGLIRLERLRSEAREGAAEVGTVYSSRCRTGRMSSTRSGLTLPSVPLCPMVKIQDRPISFGKSGASTSFGNFLP